MKFRPSSFLKRCHVSKFQKWLFFRNKSPCGSILTKGTFWKLTSYELIHFCDNLKKWCSPKIFVVVTCLHIRVKFCRTPKWCAWSIWTFSTWWILKVVTQTINFERKLQILVLGNLKLQVWGPKLIFEGLSKTNITLESILPYSWVIPAQFPYMNIWFSRKSAPNRENSINI